MLTKISIAFSLMLLSLSVRSQLNLTQLSQIDYQQLHGTLLNDIWGYVDEFGNEYALVGARKGVSIVSLADPENPVEVHWHASSESIWRDLKVYGDYAYVTTEAEAGLLIIDLSPLPNDPIVTEIYYDGPANQEWQSAHNLYIDEDGFCYIFGANRGNGGVIILDVATDPLNPIEVGTFDNWYVHDGYARDNLLYLAHINDGFLSIVDISDKANPVLLGTAQTPNNFAHNIWPSDDGKYAFTTDEISGAFLTAFNVEDPANIFEVDRIASSPGFNIVPHNTHVYQNWLVTSYYTDGITIHDISRPFNMVEVGNFDTSPLQSPNTEGCWGAYPFLPSGLILASDMQTGLHVLDPDYREASFLEGNVTDASNNNALSGVEVAITGHNQLANSANDGSYATGLFGTGTYQATYTKPLYFPQNHSVTLSEGDVAILDVALEPIPSFPFQINVLDASTNQPILDAHILISVPLHAVNTTSDGAGEAMITLYYQQDYELIVGKWGYRTHCEQLFIDNQTGSVTVLLNQGIYDDFTFDYNWTTLSTAEEGEWVREVPISGSSSAPAFDSFLDCGNIAFITGNGSTNPNSDQVIKGKVTLVSPVFDLSGFTDPHINYATWYYNFHGPNPPPDDTLKIRLSNGTENQIIEFKAFPDAPQSEWVFSSIRVLDFMSPTAFMQLFIEIEDTEARPNITEAGFDYFSVTNSNTLQTENETAVEFRVFPNPNNGSFGLFGINESHKITVQDINGRHIGVTRNGDYFSLDNTSPGIYFVRITDEQGNTEILKILLN